VIIKVISDVTGIGDIVIVDCDPAFIVVDDPCEMSGGVVVIDAVSVGKDIVNSVEVTCSVTVVDGSMTVERVVWVAARRTQLILPDLL